MALETAHVERMMEWLAPDSPVRSEFTEADVLVEKLAALVFRAAADWPTQPQWADTYRDNLLDRFAQDSGRESQFVELTGPDAAPGVFVQWFLAVVIEWESRADQDHEHDADDADEDGDEEGRYSEPARDDDYDHRDRVYQWYDEENQSWNDQTWADLYAARKHAAAGETDTGETDAGEAEPEWDENWGMFYRIGPGGVYEFADAVRPGERSSGCGPVWLSHEQVLARDAQQEAAESLHDSLLTAVDSAFEASPELKDLLTAEDIKAALRDAAKLLIDG
ncbi:hypothetical protein ACIGXM_25865 [Kitasatospora sp. NPDC052896]|uniref:hypothetical protein n=1 Tax=Kitasatospora sp. NPDC052896 TaxID=3364061 RepID=UPI0037C753CF